LLLGWRLTVPIRDILHERDAFPFYSVGNYHCRLSFSSFRFLTSGIDGLNIVAVYLKDMPAESLPLRTGVQEGLHVVHPAIDLQAVVVQKNHKVVQLIVD